MKKLNFTNDIIKRRFLIITILLAIAFSLIIIRLFSLTIFENKYYNKLLEQKTNTIYYGEDVPRGNIYDRNGKLLVGNKQIKTIVYKKEKNIKEIKEIKLANKISKIIEIDINSITNKIIEEYLYAKNKDSLLKRLTEKDKNNYKLRKITEIEYKNLIISKINKEELELTEEEKEEALIYNLMNKGYSYQEKIIKNNATEEEYAILSENEKEYPGFSATIKYERYYPYGDLFKTFLGNIGPIKKENKEKYISLGYELSDNVGISYLEEEYQTYLRGIKEKYSVNTKGVKKRLNKAKKGNDLILSIDIELQQEIENILIEEILKTKKEKNTKYFNSAYLILTNPNNGEILASAAKQVIYNGNDYQILDTLTSLIVSPVTPGSIVKGASHLVGYETGTISFGKKVTDGCIKVLNSPQKCSWKSLGVIDDIKAITLSSNYYQFLTAIKIGKGKYSYNSALKLDPSGFKIYRDIYKQFGLGVKTEIDLPKESIGYIGNDKNTSVLLDYPIGQYETYTPFQLNQYISTLASSGIRYAPHYLLKVYDNYENDDKKLVFEYNKKELNKVKVKQENMERIKYALSTVVKPGGTGNGYINTLYSPSGKTGTSQSFIDTNDDGKIDTETISTLFGAYMPSDNPELSMLVISPNVSYESGIDFRSSITKRISSKVSNLYFQKYK